MNEIGKYGVYKEKLQNLCDEHDLIFTIQNQGYPFRLTVKPAGGLDNQQTMMEGMDTAKDTGYISPDASLVFVYRDGDLSYKISETWTISATLFNKLKNLFTKLREMWFAYFFRDIHEHSPSLVSAADEADGETEMPASDNENEASDNEDDGFVTEEAGDDTDEVMDPGDGFPADEVDPFDEFLAGGDEDPGPVDEE